MWVPDFRGEIEITSSRAVGDFQIISNVISNCPSTASVPSIKPANSQITWLERDSSLLQNLVSSWASLVDRMWLIHRALLLIDTSAIWRPLCGHSVEFRGTGTSRYEAKKGATVGEKVGVIITVRGLGETLPGPGSLGTERFWGGLRPRDIWCWIMKITQNRGLTLETASHT
ncbi:predicted protein [Coccidioides posadasii str. Silveira]|uniref:Predicted protein n=2 Tax=Coccidioides posadasii TaxID=199306 RepID=E9D3X4_COCPS|nr:predicted protein [Coccidioides posadasii str. Silveira]KMM72407.1 hypothetical protein CPAG_08701 [Coccidioides posadasii RMSCC 3488]